MQYKIFPPNNVSATIQLPASKSISNRVLIINALSYSAHDVKNLSESDDTQVMLKALNSNNTTFDIGPAGTAMRFLTAFLSKIIGEWIITGSQRMKNRPIKLLVDALTELGAKIEYVEKEGYPPLKIYGSALKGKTIELEGNVSSQYISALLMIGPSIENGLSIRLKNKVISRPYIQMTISLMEYFGAQVSWEGDTIKVQGNGYVPKEFFVESDWSAASYWYLIAALLPGMATIKLPDLFKESLQGDHKVQHIFSELGVSTNFNGGVHLNSDKVALSLFEYDFINQPDLAQTVVVSCALNNIPFRFTGLQSLRIKETDRIAALINELRKLGYIITAPEDGVLQWQGETCTPDKTPVIDTYDDHRMAMAFAPAAIKFPGIVIDEPQVVSKSYPGFWSDLKKAGFTLEEI